MIHCFFDPDRMLLAVNLANIYIYGALATLVSGILAIIKIIIIIIIIIIINNNVNNMNNNIINNNKMYTLLIINNVIYN